MPGRASATSALRSQTALTNQAVYAPRRRQNRALKHGTGTPWVITSKDNTAMVQGTRLPEEEVDANSLSRF